MVRSPSEQAGETLDEAREFKVGNILSYVRCACVTFAAFLGCLNCDGVDGKNSTASCIEGSADFSDTSLPVAMANVAIDCIGPAEPPSLEVWAGSANSVLVGTVTKVCPLWEPAVVTRTFYDPPVVSADECTGFIEAGITIQIENVETLYGEDLGDTVTITFGAETIHTHMPILMFQEGQDPRWVPDTAPGRFEPGQRIGGAMYKDPELGFIGPQKHGVFFQVDRNAVVRFQTFSNGHCYQPVPVGADGLSLDELKSRLAGLDLSDPAVQEEITNRQYWDPKQRNRLDWWWGAKCFPGAECDGDEDCEDGEICSDEGFCGYGCYTDSGCGPGQACFRGVCTPIDELGNLDCPLFDASRFTSGGISGNGDGLNIRVIKNGEGYVNDATTGTVCRAMLSEDARCKVWKGLEDGQFFTMPGDPDPADCVVDGLVYHVIVWTDDGKRQVNYCEGMTEVLPVEAAFQMEKDWIEQNGRCQ